jgi:hypothetical protein
VVGSGAKWFLKKALFGGRIELALLGGREGPFSVGDKRADRKILLNTLSQALPGGERG